MDVDLERSEMSAWAEQTLTRAARGWAEWKLLVQTSADASKDGGCSFSQLRIAIVLGLDSDLDLCRVTGRVTSDLVDLWMVRCWVMSDYGLWSLVALCVCIVKKLSDWCCPEQGKRTAASESVQ